MKQFYAGVGVDGDTQWRVDRADAEKGPTGKMGVAIDSAFTSSQPGQNRHASKPNSAIQGRFGKP